LRKTHIRYRRERNSVRGVLLLEVLLAIVLLAGSVLLVLGVFPQAVRSNQQGKDLLLATNLAQKEMELCKAMEPSDFDSTFDSSREVDYTARVRGNDHTMSFRVTREFVDVTSDLKEVTVTVEWQHGEINRRTSVTTLIGAGL